jgi:hypothetical protein
VANWKTIPVNRGELKAKISSEDFDKVSKHSWRTITTNSGRKKVVTTLSTPKGYRQVTLGWFIMRPPKGKQVYARRFVEGFDYRRENLIICTMKERQRILPKSRNHGTSIYKGVSYFKKNHKWRAGIRVDGESIHLGFFSSEAAAAVAYNQAAKKYFGAESYQNQIKKSAPRRKDEAKS